MKRPLVIGHRGAPKVALENTLQSFQAAIAMSVDMFELDVQMSADGRLVVFHDYDFVRLANDERMLSDLTYSDIKKINIGGGASAPLLEEVLELAKGRAQVNIEIKSPDVEEVLLHVVKEKGMLDDIIFSSFFHGFLTIIREIEPRARIGLLYNQPIENVVEYAKGLDADAINPLYLTVEPSIVEEAHAQKLNVYPWTVNTQETMVELIKMGVDGIITDVPDICFEVIRSLAI
ncbi:MAG: glycerophosphodiester phosphodiesterase [Candidatus Thorarchaeota archaeon]